MSADPAGPVDGLNLYEYVSGNPVRMTDAEGMQGDDEVIRLPETVIEGRVEKEPEPVPVSKPTYCREFGYSTEGEMVPMTLVEGEETVEGPSAEEVLEEQVRRGGEITVDPIVKEAEEASLLAANPEKAKEAYIEWKAAQAKAKGFGATGNRVAAVEWAIRSVLINPYNDIIPAGGGLKVLGKGKALQTGVKGVQSLGEVGEEVAEQAAKKSRSAEKAVDQVGESVKGGGRSAAKKSRDQLAKAKERLTLEKEKLQELRSTPNKTKELKKQIAKQERAVRKAEDALRASEIHTRDLRGQKPPRRN